MPSKSDVKTSTINIYEKNLNKLSQDVNNSEPPSNCKWLEDFDKIMTHINKSKSLHTRKNKINTVVIYLQATKCKLSIIKKYQDEIVKLSQEITTGYNQNEKNEKQLKNWLSLAELTEFKNNLLLDLPKKFNTFDDYKKLMKYLILETHLELPLRNDLVDAQVYDEKDFSKIEEVNTTNYLVLGTKKGYLILNNYKTSGTYGRKKLDLSPELFKIWKKFYKIIIQYSKNRYIFIKEDQNKMTRNEYTKFFGSIFKSLGKNISSTMIRHIVVSEKFPVKPKEMEERKELASIMAHSVNEQQQVYSKA
jgi:hypothetical protein